MPGSFGFPGQKRFIKVKDQRKIIFVCCCVIFLTGLLHIVWCLSKNSMDHSMMNHSMHYGNGGMDHSQMNHSQMDHSQMDHSQMDHSQMDHSQMDHSQMDHSQMNGSGMGHSMMKMYFHCSTHAVILFKGWESSDWQGMLGSCIAVFIMAALYEGLKVFREYLLRRAQLNSLYYPNAVPTTEEAVIKDPQQKTIRSRMLSLAHLIQTLLHVLQIVVSYFLMLIFMTYNVYLCIAVALGAGLGYFIFGWKRAIVIDVNEHCH